jgi:DNA-binding response OmpR family regulator/MinD-like ATPase involved in chromosome partitioning or flagellar assembly
MAGKILIIEDDQTAMRLIEYALKQRGYQVLTTYNGLEGIITAQKEEPDLVILDIMLPGIDGFEVCKRLHSGTQTARIPILIVSGKNQKEDINTGFRAGADDYLPKPASPTEIISRVERLLSKKPSAQTRVVSFVNTSGLPAMTMVLVNIAAALGEQNKRVTLADINGIKKGHDGHDKDTPRPDARVVLETQLLNGETGEDSGFEVLPSGIKVLHYDEFNPSDMEVSPQIIHNIRQICTNTDYVLLALPMAAVPATSSILKYSDLAVIVSDYRLAKVLEIRNTLNLFRCLGIKPEDTSAVLVDPEGDFPGLSVCNIRPYMEANLGTTLVEVISFDAKMSQLTYLDSRPLVQVNPTHKFSLGITQIAKFVAGYDFNKKAPLPRVDHIMPALERKY